MRATTVVHAAFRNIGDSDDAGEHFCGPVKDAIFWLANRLAATSMATRFVIGIGRNREDAEKGIQVPGAGRKIINDNLKSMMDAIFADSSEEPSTAISVNTPSRIEGDDYEG